MTTAPDAQHARERTTARARQRLLAGVPVAERSLQAAGIPTAVLEGGDGPPVVLLHGPGEAAVNWRWVIPDLVTTHRVIAPDLPAHGWTGTGDDDLDEDRVIAWLDELIARTCRSAPVLVGHALGGAIGARYAGRCSDELAHLVLNDALGLGPFRPSRRFATALVRFAVRPSRRSYEQFMGQCAYDLERLRSEMGDDWTSFVDHNLGLARSEKSKVAGRLLRDIGLPRITEQDLAGITVPTTLIWGRHDRAVRLPIAQAASERYGWPLHVIDAAADDPARDQPDAFLRTLRAVIDPPGRLTPRGGTS
jgi:pimeloyl-ACP methyl ester carboxylesterase